MWQPRCPSCEETLNQVIFPTRAQQHIIQRHYAYSGNEEVDEETSHFYENVISPHMLFNTIIDEISSGLQATRIQTTYREGNRIERFLYYYQFDFIIGVYPNRQGGFCETDMIKIVCNITECQECNHRWPSEVVTSFPVSQSM